MLTGKPAKASHNVQSYSSKCYQVLGEASGPRSTLALGLSTSRTDCARLSFGDIGKTFTPSPKLRVSHISVPTRSVDSSHVVWTSCRHATTCNGRHPRRERELYVLWPGGEHRVVEILFLSIFEASVIASAKTTPLLRINERRQRMTRPRVDDGGVPLKRDGGDHSRRERMAVGSWEDVIRSVLRSSNQQKITCSLWTGNTLYVRQVISTTY